MRVSVWILPLMAAGCLLTDRNRYRDTENTDPLPPGSPSSPGTTPVPRTSAGLGDRCGDHRECASNFCLDIADDGLPSFCSRECRGDCPSGMSCRETRSGLSLCGFDEVPRGLEVGASCRFDLECVTGVCAGLAGDPRGRVCTRPCDSRGCPAQMVCATFDDGRLLCISQGHGEVGQSCGGAGDCRSGLCIDVETDATGPFCTAACTSDGECASEMACLPLSTGDLRCVFRTGSAGIGRDCRTDADCASGLCIDVQGDGRGAFCADACRATLDCPPAMRCLELDGLGPTCIY
jgi:hypothetical protein